MASKCYHPTPEQLAIAEARRLKRAKLMEDRGAEADKPYPLLSRPWVDTTKPDSANTSLIRVMTWNLLAQSLVRRELFPTSLKALKAGERQPMIHGEILRSEADILCLQEVDRLDKLLPILEKAGYSHTYAAGHGKKHGCLIAYKKLKYTQIEQETVHFDEQEVRIDGDARARKGSSFRTRNIAALLALRNIECEDEGVFVATTHLFWHPSYTYERARQAGILLRELDKFRSRMDLQRWPCIIGGDFNFGPDDPTYSLLVGDPLLPTQAQRLQNSRVVHVSIDPTVPINAAAEREENDEAESDPDKTITNARLASPADGLLSDYELQELFSCSPRFRSVYDEGQKAKHVLGGEVVTYGDRVSLPPGRLGAHEPMWTCYTHYWKNVLDYLLISDPVSGGIAVTSYLKPYLTEDLEPGLPKVNVCGSDHCSLSAELMVVR